MAVVKQLIDNFTSGIDILRFKSDNCSTQFKSKYIFYEWRSLAITIERKIVYYGVQGHGKGLVDSMSGFGVKTPLRNAIITDDFFFSSTKQLHEYLLQNHKKDDREYFHLDIIHRIDEREELKIKNCMKQHMIVYSPDGSIEVKENICDCQSCLVGELMECKLEKGKKIIGADEGANSCTDYTTSESENDSGKW